MDCHMSNALPASNQTPVITNRLPVFMLLSLFILVHLKHDHKLPTRTPREGLNSTAFLQSLDMNNLTLRGESMRANARAPDQS